MKKKKNVLLYDKDVEEIRAIALALGTEKLSEETLSKAMLISINGRKVLADKLVIKERLLKKPDFTKVKDLKDDPEKEWPESLFESEESKFDDLLKSLDDENDQRETKLSEQNKIELIDMDILSEKLIEIQGKRYFVSGLLANTEDEFREIMRNAKINVRDNFPEYVHQIEDVFNLIEIQYIQNYHFNGEYRPTPIFIFSAGNNNDIELLDYIKNLCECPFFCHKRTKL